MTRRRLINFFAKSGYREDNGVFTRGGRYGFILFGNVLIFAEGAGTERPVIVRMWDTRRIGVMLDQGDRVFIGR